MIICTIITYLFYNNYFVAMMVYYVVISLIMLDNFKKMKNREYQKRNSRKNRHINTLIAEQSDIELVKTYMIR